jgi:hypothetical protein
MPDLKFQIEDAVVVPFAAVPSLAFKLRIANQPAEETIHTIALRCQIQIEATRRRYTPEEQKRLLDLFGEPERWGQTLRSLLWTHANTVVTCFQGSTVVDLPVPCTFDFNVAATKYFEGLGEGAVPLSLMFSGTVFYATSSVPQGGNLQVAPISWQAECRYTLPVKVWREMMDDYYPNSAWLCLRRDIFDRLHQYKMQHAIPTWDALFESVIPAEEAVGK